MDRTANLLGALTLLLADELGAATQEAAGRGSAAAAALAVLAQDPGLGIEALRRPLGLTHSAVVRVVDTLESDGCAIRGRGIDGRSVSVTLTPPGLDRASALRARRGAALGEALKALAPDERSTLTGLLERLLTNLTSGRDHAGRICRLCDYSVCPEADCPVDRAVRANGTGDQSRRSSSVTP
jgi:DNA-binding MarR family transcriptional regulator